VAQIAETIPRRQYWRAAEKTHWARTLLGGPMQEARGCARWPCIVCLDASEAHIWAAFTSRGQPSHYASGRWAWVQSHFLTALS
jgi:hypothetical protein